jgi:hypothetical protein
MRLRYVLLCAALVIVAAATGGATAVALTGSANVSACTSKAKAVRVLGTSVKCRSSERKVTWNLRGPRGPAGPNPLSGLTIMVPGSACPVETTTVFAGHYGATDVLAYDFGEYPYQLVKNFSGDYSLVKGSDLLEMSSCKVS